MTLRFDQFSALWGPPLGMEAAPSGSVERISTDSRGDLGGALFVPLVGERFDGHRFLAAALAAGACGAVAERQRLEDSELRGLLALGRPIWTVSDTLIAYQELARLWRRELAIPVVAVTGSAGKTTTRELIRAVLAPLGAVVASSGNDNNDIGAPLTLLRADRGTAALVVEMGMRGLGEIERLSRCAEPDIAVITNIGTAHIGRLGSREAIATAKCEISAALSSDGLVVIPAGDPLLEAALSAAWGGRVLRVALADEPLAAGTPPPDLVGRLLAAQSPPSDGGPLPVAGQQSCAVPAEGPRHADGATTGPLGKPQAAAPSGWLQLQDHPPIRLPLPGRHNARNLLLALGVARELGVPAEALGSLSVEVPGGRSRRLQLGGIEVLDETYNASPEAMLAALDLLAGSGGGRRFAVLGTMLELGDQSLALHRSVGDRVAELAAKGGLDGLVIVAEGPEGIALQEGAEPLARIARVATPEQAAAPLNAWLQPGDTVLLKASRGVALERLLPLLEAQGPATD